MKFVNNVNFGDQIWQVSVTSSALQIFTHTCIKSRKYTRPNTYTHTFTTSNIDRRLWWCCEYMCGRNILFLLHLLLLLHRVSI